MTRHRPPLRTEHLDALFACPLIHQLAADLDTIGQQRRTHPLALHLATGAMARLYGSANRLDAEISHQPTWQRIRERYNAGAAAHGGVTVHDYTRPLIADTYRHVRDHLTTDPNLEILLESFTKHSVAIAHQVNLLHIDGPGSRTRPHPARTIYGDGTIVRPLYRPGNTGRRDPDAEQHSRHDGQIWGNDLVTIATRGPEPHRRVILAIGRVHTVGREADTAVQLIGRVHQHAGDGIQTVVYDGAFRGVHIEQLMTRHGLIVINKVHADRRNGDERIYRQVPLGQWTHTVRRRQCTHTLVAHAGAVHDSSLDDSGQLVLSPALERHQIRRYARGRAGGWRFTLGVKVPCPKASFVAWISPHPQRGDAGHGRPDQLRLIHENDEYFQTLYGLRNDSEAINSHYKRTLIADRAAALGWRRQLLDLMSWALLTNSIAWQLHRVRPSGEHRLDAAEAVHGQSLTADDDEQETPCRPSV